MKSYSDRPPLREMRRQVCHLRLVCAAPAASSCVRGVQLWVFARALRYLRRGGRVRRLLLQRMRHDREGCESRQINILLVIYFEVGNLSDVTFVVKLAVVLPNCQVFLDLNRTFFYLCAQRDGCPKIINVGAARLDMLYQRKQYGSGK